jgi:hypothetical protein
VQHDLADIDPETDPAIEIGGERPEARNQWFQEPLLTSGVIAE